MGIFSRTEEIDTSECAKGHSVAKKPHQNVKYVEYFCKRCGCELDGRVVAEHFFDHHQQVTDRVRQLEREVAIYKGLLLEFKPEIA